MKLFRFLPLLALLLSCSVNHYRQGRTLLRQKNYSEAYTAFDHYVKSNPDIPRAWLNRAYTAWLMGNKDQAYRDIEKLLQLDSVNVLALCNRGFMDQKAGRIEQALKYYNKALSIDRKSADAYLNRASLHLEQGRRDDAMNDMKKALKYGRFSEHNFSCTRGMHYYFRGIARMQKQEYEGAILYFTRAIKTDPLNGRAYYERGLAHGAINDKRSACADLQKARELGISVGDEKLAFNCDCK